MSRRSRRPSWKGATLVVLIAIGAGGYYLLWRDREMNKGRDPRPIGTIADIERLSQRKDVNVLFILVDTLRAHRIRTYGYERETSPTIDYLAASGVRFARHLSQSSWTKCSMASLWTGFYPVRTGVLRFD